MAIIDDFKAAFPNFPSAKVDQLFPDLLLEYPVYYAPLYGTAPNTSRSILLLLAHLFVVEKTPTDTQFNQFSSNGTDTVSASFRVKPDPTDFISFFNATKYGQRFLLSIKKRQGGVFV